MAAGDVERVVAALRDPTRRDILFSFFQRPAARTVDEVARDSGVHRTVAFGHLERLAALGYLALDRRRGAVGKPANLYRLASGPVSLSHPAREFQLLSRLLGESLQRFGGAGLAAARAAGEAYGAGLGRPSETIDEALAPLAGLGAFYRRHGEGRMVTGNCIFREACGPAGGLACHVHAGVLEGTLRAAGIEARVSPEGPGDLFACGFQLSPPATLSA